MSSHSCDVRFHRDFDQSAAAGDLTAIRALLQAIAQHNLIEIPKEAGSLATSRNTGDVDPRGSLYNEAETIDYHIRQLRNGGLNLRSETGDEVSEAATPQSKDLGPGVFSSRCGNLIRSGTIATSTTASLDTTRTGMFAALNMATQCWCRIRHSLGTGVMFRGGMR